MKKIKKYIKPKIKRRKVKLNYFLSKVFWLDQFNFIGTVYAQSGGYDGGYDAYMSHDPGCCS